MERKEFLLPHKLHDHKAYLAAAASQASQG
jgi:hypothetical protein